MKMVSMKLSRSERTDSPVLSEPAREAYPYGLALSLDEDAIKKLKLGELPAVGEELLLMARVSVRSVSEHESTEGSHRSLSLQITAMSLDAPAAAKHDAMYTK